MNHKIRTAHDASGILIRIAENWSAILLVTVLCASAFFSYGRFAMPPQFTSTAVLYTLDGNAAELSAGQTDTGLARDCAYAAESQAVLSRVISEQTLSYTYRELADKVEVVNPEGTHVVEITVTDKSSESAKKLADAIAETAISYISSEMGQSAPRVLSYGFTGGRTVTVSPLKPACIGGITGLIISLIVCLIRALSDDRILVPGDLKSSGFKVIGVVPGEE